MTICTPERRCSCRSECAAALPAAAGVCMLSPSGLWMQGWGCGVAVVLCRWWTCSARRIRYLHLAGLPAWDQWLPLQTAVSRPLAAEALLGIGKSEDGPKAFSVTDQCKAWVSRPEQGIAS